MATHLRMGQWGSPNEDGTNVVIGSVRTVGAGCSAGGVDGVAERSRGACH